MSRHHAHELAGGQGASLPPSRSLPRACAIRSTSVRAGLTFPAAWLSRATSRPMLSRCGSHAGFQGHPHTGTTGQLIERRVPGLCAAFSRLLTLLFCRAGFLVSCPYLAEQARCFPISLRAIISQTCLSLRAARISDGFVNARATGYLLSADTADVLLPAMQPLRSFENRKDHTS